MESIQQKSTQQKLELMLILIFSRGRCYSQGSWVQNPEVPPSGSKEKQWSKWWQWFDLPGTWWCANSSSLCPCYFSQVGLLTCLSTYIFIFQFCTLVRLSIRLPIRCTRSAVTGFCSNYSMILYCSAFFFSVCNKLLVPYLIHVYTWRATLDFKLETMSITANSINSRCYSGIRDGAGIKNWIA